jgi:hypothetical protein
LEWQGDTFAVERIVRMSRFSRAAVLALALSLLLPLASPALAQSEEVVTAVAVQSFQNGYMFWREDLDKITVVYWSVRTKSDEPCSEVYRDTYDGQPYEIPPPPSGFATPTLGFGWLYKNDPDMAQRLGHAFHEEVSQVASITTETTEGGRRVRVELPDGLPGSGLRKLTASDPDEPGLTYCFPRRGENRNVLNTWTSRQLFEHGAMVWRQDMPDRIEVWHYDTQLAPELACGDTLVDAWRPGKDLAYGDLAVPGKPLPVRGFGQIWLEREYVRTSLGHPIGEEQGGFAEIAYEPFTHPTRGNLLIRHMTVRIPGLPDWTSRITIPNATSPANDRDLSTACERILIPHQGTHQR